MIKQNFFKKNNFREEGVITKKLKIRKRQGNRMDKKSQKVTEVLR